MFEIMPNSNLKNFAEKSAKGLLAFGVFSRNKNSVAERIEMWANGGKSCEKYVFLIEIEIATVVLEISREIYGFSYSVYQKSVKYYQKNVQRGLPLVLFREKKILSQNESKCGQTGRQSCEKYVFQIEIEIATVVLEITREIFRFSYSIDVSH